MSRRHTWFWRFRPRKQLETQHLRRVVAFTLWPLSGIIEYYAGWAAPPVWTLWQRQPRPSRIRTPLPLSIQHLSHEGCTDLSFRLRCELWCFSKVRVWCPSFYPIGEDRFYQSLGTHLPNCSAWHSSGMVPHIPLIRHGPVIRRHNVIPKPFPRNDGGGGRYKYINTDIREILTKYPVEMALVSFIHKVPRLSL
jgi:hypothetical protein